MIITHSDCLVHDLKTLTNLLSALGVSADYLIFGTDDTKQSEKESALNNFTNLLKRGNTEDINALYQLAAHMLRNKNQHDLNEFDHQM